MLSRISLIIGIVLLPVVAASIEVNHPTKMYLLPLSGDTGEQVISAVCAPTNGSDYNNPSRISCKFTAVSISPK